MTKQATNPQTLVWQAMSRDHHLAPFSDYQQLSDTGPRIIVKGDGVYVWDSEGNKILDGMAGLWCAAIGYGRDELADAASKQMKELPFYNTFRGTTHPRAIELSARVVDLMAPDGVAAVMFSNGGSDAVEGALKIARHALGRSTLTLPLPELLLNNQLSQRAADYPAVDSLRVDCSHDLLRIKVDGHYQRVVYTVDVRFAVLSCEIGQAGKYLHLQQVGEDLDAQLRQAGFAVNWVTRQVGRQAFRLANRLPLVAPVRHVIRDIPGVELIAPKRWRIDLEAAGLIDFLNDRAWMLERLLALNDQLLPGLPILRQSRDLLLELVEQLEIRDIRVRTGRLDVVVGIDGD